MNKRIKKIVTFTAIVLLLGLIKPAYEVHTSVQANSSVYKDKTASSEISRVDNYSINEEINFSKKEQRKAKLIFKADESAGIDKLGMSYGVEGKREDRPDFSFYDGDNYSDIPGVTCFRGNNTRSSASFGTVDVKEGRLEVLWTKSIGSIDSWTGVGWNGQPSIVLWNKKVRESMNIKDSKKYKDNLKEVIYATLDGNVYFLDLDDGSDTREALRIGAPVKGSLTVDPRGIPLLYVGQGIDTNKGNYVDFAYRIFSLLDYNKLYEIKGRDSFAKRDWGAFDSTALVDKVNDYLFICGENGVFYSGKLNTKYENDKIEIKPELDKYRYDVENKYKKGIENSIAIYKNYGYFADNDGILQCIDLKTLNPVWALNVNDDTDSTAVLEKEPYKLNLYTACEVDLQGQNGYSYVRKIDGCTGKILWENKYKCAYVDEVNGGALATPVVGKDDISNLVIFNIARTPNANEGVLVAIDKESGKEVWSIALKNYCWSSPICIHDENGKSYIVQCDSTGKAMLIEGISGKIMDTIELGANVEGSPAAFNNVLVVGTRGGKIIGLKIK